MFYIDININVMINRTRNTVKDVEASEMEFLKKQQLIAEAAEREREERRKMHEENKSEPIFEIK